MTKKIFFLIVIFIFTCINYSYSKNEKTIKKTKLKQERIVVFKFDYLSKSNKNLYVSDILLDNIYKDIQRNKNYKVRKVYSVVKLPKDQNTKNINNNKSYIAKLSKSAKKYRADYLISGQYSIDNNVLTIQSHMFIVKSKELVDIGTTKQDFKVFLRIENSNLSNKVSDHLDIINPNLALVKKPLTREQKLTTYSDLLRLSFSSSKLINMNDNELDNYYKNIFAINADIFLYRQKGLYNIDLYSRIGYKYFRRDDSALSSSEYLEYDESNMMMANLDLGVRFSAGMVFWSQLWQVYVLAAPRLNYYRESVKDQSDDVDEKNNFYSLGFVGGIGFEVTLFPEMGIFVEYNNGYTPVGDSKANVEGHQVYLGVSLRTEVL